MDLVKYLAVSMILFLLGIWGIFLNRKNIIVMLMSIELMLLAVNLNFLIVFCILRRFNWTTFCFINFNSGCSRICYWISTYL